MTIKDFILKIDELRNKTKNEMQFNEYVPSFSEAINCLSVEKISLFLTKDFSVDNQFISNQLILYLLKAEKESEDLIKLYQLENINILIPYFDNYEIKTYRGTLHESELTLSIKTAYVNSLKALKDTMYNSFKEKDFLIKQDDILEKAEYLYSTIKSLSSDTLSKEELERQELMKSRLNDKFFNYYTDLDGCLHPQARTKWKRILIKTITPDNEEKLYTITNSYPNISYHCNVYNKSVKTREKEINEVFIKFQETKEICTSCKVLPYSNTFDEEDEFYKAYEFYN